ncbi:MAG: serine hydrolase [Proteobacteria bacterium]|nr:serine hydrolase [Pseudomonadota bacterium]MBI3499350.1 serine hydrolase [Pseudomonadota bacterium]
MIDDEKIRRTIERALEHWRVPGGAVSIRRGGRKLYEGCFGVKRLGERARIGKHTQFDIGSVSKTFNAAAMALLVEEGRLAWDTRAIDVLPEFRLADPAIAEQVTMRDLIAHRIGHGEDAITNYSSHFTRAEILAQMRVLPLRAPFRSETCYQSYGPLAAAAVVERLSGLSWEDYVEARILKPLGLADAAPTYERLRNKRASSSPHADFGRGVEAMAHRDFSNLAPAGSMVASLADLASWADIHANRGLGFLKPATLGEMFTPHSLVHPRGISPVRWHSRFAATIVSYGLGWYVHDFIGHRVVEHTGALEGYIALVIVVPEERLGIVILTNLHQTPAPLALRYALLSLCLGGPERDWIALAEAKLRAIPKARPLADGTPYYYRPIGRRQGTKPSVPLRALAGRYRHGGYGDIAVTFARGRLKADIVGNACDLEHWHWNEFRAVPKDRGVKLYYKELFLRFAADGAGALTRLVIPSLAEFRRR